jgi:glycosyltransferase involved in cell wall biosynthesis
MGMRIGTIFTYRGPRAGAEMHFQKMINLLAERPNIELVLFCNSQAYKDIKLYSNNIKKILIRSLDNQVTKAIWTELFLGNACKEQGIDLFWVFSGASDFPGKLSCPSVVQILDIGEFVVPHKYDLFRTIYRTSISLRMSCKRASAIIAISRATASDIKKYLKYNGRIELIYPGGSPWNREEIREDPADIIARETGLKFTDIILYVGRTDYIGKGLDNLIAAYQHLIKKNSFPCPRLVLVGPQGWGHSRLLRDLSRNHLCQHIFYLGRVSDLCLEALYSISKLIIVPSRYEGFGFPLIEAMERRVPVICSRVASLPEIGGDAVLYFKAEDPFDMSNTIAKLLQDESLRLNLIEKGVQRVKQFSWDSTVDKTLAVFDSVLRSFIETEKKARR